MPRAARVSRVERTPAARGYVRKREQTRRRLLEAAKRVLAEKGVDAATISEIAIAAETVPGTFYNYFDSKEEVLEAVATDLAAQFQGVMDRIQTTVSDPAERIAVSLRLFLERLEDDPLWGWFMVRFGPSHPILRDATRDILRHGMLADGIRTGRFRVRSTRAVGDLVAGTAFAALRSILDGRESIEIASEIAEIVLRALGLPEREAWKIASRPIPSLGERAAR